MTLNKYITSCCIGKTTRSRSHFSAEQGVGMTPTVNINHKISCLFIQAISVLLKKNELMHQMKRCTFVGCLAGIRRLLMFP